MFEDVWSDLELKLPAQGGPGIVKRMIGTDLACPVFIGIKVPGAVRTFILQVPKEIAPLPESVPECSGLHFNVQITGDEVLRDHVSLILCSSVSAYNDIFTSIAEDLFASLKATAKKTEMVSGFLCRIRLWQAFFERQSDTGLSEEAQRGLYGELRFLRDYVISDPDNLENAIRSWTGPRNRQHDFQSGAVAVEVKTSAAKQHQKLEIASELQLDESTTESLYLYYLSIAITQGGNDTLPALIDTIRGALDTVPQARAEFESRLIEAGYLDVHRDRYFQTGYTIRESALFQVSDEFPRIRENELRSGVGDVRYSISVARCRAFEIPQEQIAETVRGLAA